VQRLAILLTLALLPALAWSSPQTLYKTVGPDGKVSYSDRPPADGRIDKKLSFESLPSTPLPPPSSAYLEWLKTRPALAPAVSDEVVLYAAAWCGYCRQARTYLRAKGIAYRDVDIETDAGRHAFSVNGGGKGIPFIVRGKAQMRGFSAAGYDAFFAPGR
jgi:glutaredoxin